MTLQAARTGRRPGRRFTEFVCASVPRRDKDRLREMADETGASMSLLLRGAIDLLVAGNAVPGEESGPGSPSENLVALVTYGQKMALENYAEQHGVTISEATRVAIGQLLD